MNILSIKNQQYLPRATIYKHITLARMTSVALTTETAQSHQRGRTATLIAFILAGAAESWTSTGISLTLTDLTGTLSASSDEASWALTVYSTAYAVSVGCAHRFSSLLGNRTYLASMAALFAVASLGCAGSDSLAAFLLCRAIEGFAGGAFLTRTFVFTTLQFDPPQRPPALVFWAISYFTIGRVFSPLLNGWFADNFTWRALFLVGALLSAVASFLFGQFALRSWHENPEEQFGLDFTGLSLLVFGVVCIQTVLSRGEIDAWFESSRIVLLLLVGIAANAVFTVWVLHPRNRNPLFRLGLVRTRAALAAAALGYPIGMLLAGSVYVLPQYLRTIEVHSATQAGLLLSLGSTAAVGVLVAFRLTSQTIRRFGGSAVLACALLIECASQLLFAHYLTVDTPDRFLWLPLMLNGAFITLSVPTLSLVIFSQMDYADLSTARTIYYGARQFGASLGVTSAVVLIDRRLSLHTTRLLDAYVNRNLAVLGASDPTQIPLQVHAAIHRQAFVLADADVFHVMALIAFVTLFFVPLLPRQAKAAPTPSSTSTNGFVNGGRTV